MSDEKAAEAVEETNEAFDVTEPEDRRLDVYEEEEESQEETTVAPDETESESESESTEEDSFTPDVLSRAAQWGMSEERARAYGSPELVDKTIELLAGSAMQRAQTQPQAQQQQQTQQPAPQLDADDELQLPKLEFGDDEIEESIAKKLTVYTESVNNILKRVNDQNRQLQGAVQQSMGAISSYQLREQVATLDSVIGGLGESMQETFGKGPTTRMSPESQQFKNRQQVFSTATAIAQGLINQGTPPQRLPPDDEIYRQAVRAVFGDQLAKAEKDQIAAGLKKQSSQAIARPSGRKSKMSEHERHTQAVIKYQREARQEANAAAVIE